MKIFWICCGSLAGLLLLWLGACYLCYRLAFRAVKEKNPEEYSIPRGKIYEPHRDTMIAWMKELRAMPYEEMSIRSFDGLRLYGKFYEFSPHAPIELMFHGYRGTAERDLCGGVQRCFALGHSALVVDQRSSGKSEGKVITFGICEHRDCLDWAELLHRRFGPQRKILLTGISMGAATVLMAAGKPLPENVAGVLADCGYSAPKEIICKVLRQLRLPVGIFYPLLRSGARLFGGFSPEEYTPLQAMGRCTVPVLLIHGEDDRFVPCEMSRQLYEACTSPKELLTVPKAGHGLSYLEDPKSYMAALHRFFDPLTKNDNTRTNTDGKYN